MDNILKGLHFILTDLTIILARTVPMFWDKLLCQLVQIVTPKPTYKPKSFSP